MPGSAPSSPGPRTENAATLERSPTSEPAQGLAPAWSPSLSVSPGGRAFMVLPPSPPKSVRAPQPASAIATSAGSASTSPKRKRNERAPRAHGPAEPAELAELAVSTEAQAHRGPSVLQLSPLILAPVAPLGREEEVERERRAPLMTELTWVRLEGGAAIALAPNGPKAAFAVSRAQVAACYDNVHLEAGLRSIDRNAETVAYYLARPQALNAWLAQAHLHGIRLVNANDFLRSHFAKVSIFLDA